MKYRILVTGVAGFIGRHAARYLCNQGHEIVGIDIVSAENTSLNDITKYHQLDLTDRHGVSLMISSTRPDVCIHAAGRASVPFSMTHPDIDFDSGPLATFNLLNAIRTHAPECRFIFLSSAAVYGNPVSLPVVESMACQPLSAYGYHKLVSENICSEFSNVYKIRTAVLRIFSAYGPGLRRQVVWDIANKMLQGGQILLHGTGLESRDFINVSDILQAIGLLIEQSDFRSDLYNLASGEETRIRDLAELVQNHLDITEEIIFDGENPEGNPLNWRADITRLKALGFIPAVSLELGVQTFLAWVKNDLMLP